jgi:hypothetical protein
MIRRNYSLEKMSAMLARSIRHAEQAIEAVHHQCHTVLAKFNTALQNETVRPRHTIYIALVGIMSMWLVLSFITRLRPRMRQSTTRPSTPNLEKRSPFKTVDREPGGTLHAHLFLWHKQYLRLDCTC